MHELILLGIGGLVFLGIVVALTLTILIRHQMNQLEQKLWRSTSSESDHDRF